VVVKGDNRVIKAYNRVKKHDGKRFISILRSFIKIDKYNNLYNVSSFIYM